MSGVAIVDYRLCNLDSIHRAIEQCGGAPYIAQSPDDLKDCDRIILPGVGSFARAMQNLHETGFAAALPELVRSKNIPLLGICLGMQLLAEAGTEGGAVAGLGLLHGRVTRLEAQTDGNGERIPHMGWNDVTPVGSSPIFDGIDTGTNFYFLHSYRLDSPGDEVLATVDYCGRTVAAAGRDNVMAVQFHPEKSQTAGFRLLRNFLAF
jgi:glutamine amidotransferase